jgi:uncharacterized protein (DUF2164 family)
LLRVTQLSGQLGLRAYNEGMQQAQAVACFRQKWP